MRSRYDVLYKRLSVANAARKYGVVRSTIWRWMKQSPGKNQYMYTRSSAPHHHPNQLSPTIVSRIITLRKELHRCAPVIHEHLKREGIIVSLSSVERTLRREKSTRKKRQANWYTPLPKPAILFPGSLVQMDTIHYVKPHRFYLYTLIDVYSRLAYAEYHPKLLQQTSFEVILRAQKLFGFPFLMLQTDNGPEFQDGLQGALGRAHIKIRHSRVHKPNDNAHIERFNRTIQEECFRKKPPNEFTVQDELEKYIAFYNNHRLHLSLDLLTPTKFVA